MSAPKVSTVNSDLDGEIRRADKHRLARICIRFKEGQKILCNLSSGSSHAKFSVTELYHTYM